MIYPIVIYGSPGLRDVTEDVAGRESVTPQLVDDMFETMYNADGVGLAAPQIGKPLRMFVVDLSVYADEHPELAGFRKVFINPHIYERTGEEVSSEEGCLSVPGIHESVVRPSTIRMRYMDLEWVEHDDLFEGYMARVLQHEYDHLDGVMFVDKVSPLRKTLLKSKLAAMSRGRYKAAYKTILKK